MSGLVVIGGSYAGLTTASAARESGYLEPITIIGNEAHLPYQRPPLSKAFLLGDADEQSLLIRAARFFVDQNIDVRLGTSVTGVDRRAKRVELSDGRSLTYDALAFSTGSRARRLDIPGATLSGICYLRSLGDAVELRDRLAAAKDVVVIGGGFIGLEVAASARHLGKTVTVIESAARLLERAVTPLIADYLLREHQAKGVRVHFDETVREFAGDGVKVSSVILRSNERIAADLVLIGIGGLPNDDVARAAGLTCTNGIVVDDFGRSRDDACISAAGDCANHHSGFARGWIRLESVQNAQDQARITGSTIAGQERPYNSVPLFWSDQYDTKLQMVGFSKGHDRFAMRGRPDDGQFSVFYYRTGELIAVDSVNRPADQLIAKRLLAAGLSPGIDQVGDMSFDFKTFLKRGIEKSAAR
ncbi:MAG: FAD-dependent oxidoreductase [Methylobacteriaceae bacterium]|nr:FAD-dependent oxidoreductase [Methylobacteriaceae bacterium]